MVPGGFRTKHHWRLAPLSGLEGSLLFGSGSMVTWQLQDDLHGISYRLRFVGGGAVVDIPAAPIPYGLTALPEVRRPEDLQLVPVRSRTAVGMRSFWGLGCVIGVSAALGFGVSRQIVVFGIGTKRYAELILRELPRALLHPGSLASLLPIYAVCSGLVNGLAMPAVSVQLGNFSRA